VAEVVKMPKWGLTMERGMIVKWLVSVGSRVERGGVLATVETEKVEVDLEAPAAGVVADLLVGEGEEVPVGTDLAVLVADEAELEAHRG
jgi:pyruvate/2-oxoglutarate dehydrogenase complex dihydrolipoamide acyltransferase (E2) component